MKAVLTDITIRSLRPGVYFDQKTPAFGIRVGTLRKTWLVVRGKTRTQTVIGHYPQLGLAEARAKAKAILLEKPEAPKPKATTFAEARSAYLAEHTGRPRTVKEATRLLTKHFATLDAKQLPVITDKDISDVIAPLRRSEGLHAFRTVRAMLKWCVRPPRRFLPHSPLEGMSLPASDGRRTRVLSDQELSLILGHSGRSGAILRLMVLWGTRKGETLALRRDWIVDDVLTIPAEITKNGRPHTIPILPLARTTLDSLPNNGPYYFPARHDKSAHLNEGSWTKLHKEVLKATSTSGWSAHDCRRTMRSLAARLGVRREIAERLLNHAQGTLDEIYDHHDYLTEKTEALAKIETFVLGLSAQGTNANPGHARVSSLDGGCDACGDVQRDEGDEGMPVVAGTPGSAGSRRAVAF